MEEKKCRAHNGPAECDAVAPRGPPTPSPSMTPATLRSWPFAGSSGVAKVTVILSSILGGGSVVQYRYLASITLPPNINDAEHVPCMLLL